MTDELTSVPAAGAAARSTSDAGRAPHPLDRVLRPRSVAIVGASGDPRKRGHQAVRALRDSGYRGEVFPVNPKGGELFGRAVARSLDGVPDDVDLALICTPAPTVPDIAAACARKGMAGAVVLALGFGESGGAGELLERRLRDVAARTGIRVIGPNTSGLVNTSIGLNLIGVDGVGSGGLAFVVQSGNMALRLLERAKSADLGVSVCVGIGNALDIGLHEYLDYLAADSDTAAILMYVESFRDGRAFLETARRTTRVKPVVVLKGGRSAAGGAATRSHTGAVAGEYATVSAALRQAGVVEVRRSDELLPVGAMLARQPPVPDGAAIAVLTDGGGEAALASDRLSELGVPLASPSAATRRRLRDRLGPSAAVGNPVDVAGAADDDPAAFADGLRLLLDDDGVGGVLVSGLLGGYALRFTAELGDAEARAADAFATVAALAGKPVVAASIYAEAGTAPVRRLRSAGIPVVRSLDVACRCIAAAWSYGRVRARPAPTADDVSGPPAPAASTSLADARSEGRAVLLEPEARALVREYGASVAPARLCASDADIATAATAFDGAVALKVVSPRITHKLEAGGVALGVPDGDAAVGAWARMRESVAAYAAARGEDADIRGVLVSPMLPAPVAEVLVGAHRDPAFGPVLTVGAGGSAVEVLRDVASRVLPVTAAEVSAMLDEPRIGRLLDGFRGRPAADRDALIDFALAIARCALANPDVAEIEANPVFAYPDRAVAVDVRAFLGGAAAAEG